ncbi:MAG: hypothetical protein NTW30_01835, partial [Candidatus Aenigmarchaeota archaeon]|nr:hypothetical protein [Candidatus Aenigmarchaeota archaeon]
MKKFKNFIIIFSLIIFLITPSSVYAALTCTVKTSCSGTGEVPIFRMSDTTNALAGTFSGSSYPYIVCCSGVNGLGTACSGNYDIVLKLSGTDNAHVEDSAGSNYNTNICISGPSSPVRCMALTSCNNDYPVPLASVSSPGVHFTNAHVGDSTAYQNKICCNVPEGTVVTTTTTTITTPCNMNVLTAYYSHCPTCLGMTPLLNRYVYCQCDSGTTYCNPNKYYCSLSSTNSGWPTWDCYVVPPLPTTTSTTTTVTSTTTSTILTTTSTTTIQTTTSSTTTTSGVTTTTSGVTTSTILQCSSFPTSCRACVSSAVVQCEWCQNPIT